MNTARVYLGASRLVFIFVFVCAAFSTHAQTWMHKHYTRLGTQWVVPQRIDSTEILVNDGLLFSTRTTKEGAEIIMLDTLARLDSITFVPSLSDEEKGHNKYRCFTMNITTENQSPIAQKELWVPCHISIDGKGEFSDYDGTARIRGRGNSTWEWYDKKPYKFKLDQKSKLLGMDKAKDWNLLANYRDVTDVMNTFAFEAARYMGMPFTNHTRYVEVFLNGKYIGLYQLTEKIEVDPNRVNIDPTEGILFSLDADDGPSLSPGQTDNCNSKIYGLPLCLKYPDDATTTQTQALRNDFAQLEQAIKDLNYTRVEELMDVRSFISMLQLHEFLYNVEIDAPRSMYVFRDKGGKFTFGPVWDWDAGYDFDWSNMTTGHKFFADYTELIYGTDPYHKYGAAYQISDFFTRLFKHRKFVAQYKQQWNEVKDSLYLEPWSKVQPWVDELRTGPYDRDIERWPLPGFRYVQEITRLRTWLLHRLSYLNTIIPNYPDGSVQ